MPKAVWNGTILAESDKTEVVDGNHYFPPESIQREHMRDSEKTTECGWKGTAKYFTLDIGGGQVNEDAAWYYPDPKPAAANIKDHVAFSSGVDVM